ncbi:tRNA(Met) cytidine acetyltransferase, partial [Halobacteriales archaeon QH_3_68_24]
DPAGATYRRLDADDLLADEHLLREAFGLLVLAHYRTEPDDLARLLDAPNVSARALTCEGHVVSVALLAREGNLPADLRAHMYEGGRVRGNMVPDVLTSQLRDEAAGVPVGQRVLRIATHPAARSRGFGSRLLRETEREVGDEVDWIGTGFGATPELLRFWRANGFRTVHLSTSRNDASGEYSAVMLRPTSDAGRALADRHARWFCRRAPSVLSDPLDDADPDVVREALRAADATPDLGLTDREWRHLAGLPHGASVFDTAPRPLRRLALRYLVDAGGRPGENADEGSEPPLDPREERLLVRKALQGASWRAATEELGFAARSECMRTLGQAVRPLLSRYGGALVQPELERYE